MAHLEYTIPRTLWESLDGVLFNKGLVLAKEIAKELNMSPQPLIALLKGDERGKFSLIPDSELSKYQCEALIHCGSTLMRCRCASLRVNPSLCSAHERGVCDLPSNLPIVQRLITPEAVYMAKGEEVYTLNGQQCGLFKSGRLTIFEIDD